MSSAGTPTDNGAMESINGWLKEDPIKCIEETSLSSMRKGLLIHLII